MSTEMGPLGWAQMHREHQAWLAIGIELKRAGIDLNEESGLHAALVLWGEQLAHLRMMHDRETWDRAMTEAERLFNEHIGFLPY